MAFEGKKKEQKPEYNLPEICGIPGCANPCDIYMKHKNISRCSKHYQEDVDKWSKNHRRGSADRHTQRMMAEKSHLYQNVKSGTHLAKILRSLSGRGKQNLTG